MKWGPVKGKAVLKNAGRHRQDGQSGYNGSFQAPPSPVWSPASVERDRMFRESERIVKHRDDDGGVVKRRDGERVVVKKRDGERRERGHQSHSHGGSHHSHHHRSERERERGEREREGREREREKGEGKERKRWKDNLTAAGIGGAAASLINVLTEAAEGL